MNIQALSVTQQQAAEALLQYKEHRDTYDKRDWEIERIYRAITRGKVVVPALEAIRNAGIDEQGYPKLAIMRADQQACRCIAWRGDKVTITNEHRSTAREWHFEIPWPERLKKRPQDGIALLPRIPPQHRPAKETLTKYHLLWEANWVAAPPRDPMLLKRIGRDAWVVLAAWDLTEVEMNVLRAYQEPR